MSLSQYSVSAIAAYRESKNVVVNVIVASVFCFKGCLNRKFYVTFSKITIQILNKTFHSSPLRFIHHRCHRLCNHVF